MRFFPLLMIAALVGCTPSDADKPVWIGHIHPTDLEDDEYRALQMAVEELNADVGRLPQGRRIQIRHAPGGSRPEDWGNQAARLIALNRVTGLIGGQRANQAEQIGMATQGEDVVVVCPAGWGGGSGQNLFTVGLSPGERGRALAQSVRGARSALILRDPRARAANRAADRFAEDLRATGAVIAQGELADAVKPAADVIFFACPARLAVQHYPKSGRPLFGGEDAELAELMAMGDAANGFHIATPVDPASTPTPFATRFQEVHYRPPSLAAVLAHDALSVWLEAARRARGYESADLRAELLKREKPFEIQGGTLTFASDHSARRPIHVGAFQGGQLIGPRRIEPASVP